MAPGATVTAAKPRKDHIDLFVTDADGIVWTTWWEPDEPNWQFWREIHPEKMKTSPGATVTALVRENHVDLYATGSDGSPDSDGTVWTAGKDTPDVQWAGWFAIHPDGVKMAPAATVTALNPRDGHIDLFVTGGDGTVWSAWWEPVPGW